MAWTIFYSYKESLFDPTVIGGAVDLEGDTIKIMLIDDTLAPLVGTHNFIDDLNTNEVTGTNYTAGGEIVANDTVTETGGVVTYDGDDTTWAQSGTGFANARYAVLYKDTGTPATSPLITFHDFGSDKGNVAGPFTLQMDSDGILTLS